ncbi:hypothetical protein FFT09_22755 [Saccharomonospora piscinae]|uniref:hypothetical protein n=1 Tax=Saccharomonospora piscinae TaxID=687388 RepID=UPI001105E051|nr:hypothetical protein [Saccharomonospora piscinae]TLW89250.1 hypothetical protein FFT09_22755 [Saccharomonospora piscinae]
MAGHRRTRKAGAPTLRARHHTNAKRHALERIESTSDPALRLRYATDYVLSARRHSEQRGRTAATHPAVAEAIEVAVRALIRCGDNLLDPSKKGR